ncbi:GNAT family N-acetyltransferase [Pelomonas sp. CA6]|uniref:GNAT family N-acetyltransferase n=1 Tax=Pelomonas sp. CA6 TaxID=2907999 RepID=UPI001F4BE158|nr:GNAT family N-acetyltransferase [Pelomonas sp. CA6]MCH7345356.1 GNAT family N-acetyltransferase [Pelomonas sp. CA6]
MPDALPSRPSDAAPRLEIPVLETERLRLLAPGPACAAAYQSFYTDAQASYFYGGPLTPGAAWARLAADLGSWALQGFGVWAVQRRADAAIVGVCGFWQGLGWPRELTWWLLPQARGQGLALEASRAALRQAYDGWRWPSVQTYMKDDNAAARALVLRLGGVRVGRPDFPDGMARDLYELPPC